MYFTFAEKVGNSFLQEWHVRLFAFDSSRRYLYYSEPIPERKKAKDGREKNIQSIPKERSPRSAASAGSSTHSRFLNSSDQASVVDHFIFSSGDPINTIDMSVKPNDVVWKLKMKVLSVEPVMTQVEFTIEDPHMQERDLFRLRIRGELRPLAEGETPPMGPLLCSSAAPTPLPTCLTPDSEDLIDDPLLLKEIFNGLRDQYQQINDDRARIEREAVAAGQPAPVFQRQTIDSPKKRTGFFPPSKKTILIRNRDEREFRRFWYLLQIVLGYDKLIVRPYRGLPPFDPRNGISFAHIPIYVWHTFKDLDKAVFYIFTRGMILNCCIGDGDSEDPAPNDFSRRTEGRSSAGNAPVVDGNGSNESIRVDVALKCAYLSITHDMVLLMRNTGNIPRWVRLQEVNAFHYNVTAAQPFVVFLTDPNAPDIIFVPQPPLFGPDAIRNYDPRYDVRRIAKVMHDSCFASQTIRRVINIVEVTDRSITSYARRMANKVGRPLSTTASAGYTSNSTVSCPLPKEQLAAVWQQVQTDILERSTGADENRLAIPLYSNTATNINLTPEALVQLGRRLAAERDGRDDIVGINLAELQHVAASTESDGQLSGRQGDSEEQSPISSSPLVFHRVDHSSFASSRHADAAANIMVLPPTVALLHTPQLQGGRVMCRGSLTTVSERSDPSEYGNSHAYYVPRSNDSTEEEEEVGSGGIEEHASYSSFREATDQEQDMQSRSIRPRGRKTVSGLGRTSNRSGAFEERRVGELVQCSMDAMQSVSSPLEGIRNTSKGK